jgi:ADP-ribosylglycohydrolase
MTIDSFHDIAILRITSGHMLGLKTTLNKPHAHARYVTPRKEQLLPVLAVGPAKFKPPVVHACLCNMSSKQPIVRLLPSCLKHQGLPNPFQIQTFWDNDCSWGSLRLQHHVWTRTLEDRSAQKISEEVKNPIQDRIHGTIFGAACGNSLGGSCIGLSHKDILATVGISRLKDFEPGLSRSFLPDHKPGNLLADVLMGLSLAESLIEKGGRFDPLDLKSRYRQLLEDPEFVNSAPGVQCLAALRRMVDEVRLSEDVLEATHSSGACRAFAAGCLPGGKQSDEPVEVAIKQAELSHSDRRVACSAAVIADSIRYFIEGNKIVTVDEVRQYVIREYELAKKIDARFAESWDGVAPDLDYTRPAEELPYSLVNVEFDVCESVPTAVGIFLIFRHNLEAAVCAAARSGGDTDTIGAIVGALSGAYHGISNIPRRWTDQIAQSTRLQNIANGMDKLWKQTEKK